MLEIKHISPNETWNLRHKILWPEKPIDFCILDEDNEGLHYGVFRDDCSEALSVISLFVGADVAQFRKFATDDVEQGKGYGSMLLKHVIDVSRSYGNSLIWCNARLSAFKFYQKFGFEITSDIFSKEDVEYVKMSLNI